jgi:hypothetical protein
MENWDTKFNHNETEKWIYDTGIKWIETKKANIIFIDLTLLTETCMNVEQYGGHSEALVPVMAVVCMCQADTESTGGKGYGQPQAVAEWCDVAIPCHIGVVG